MKTVILNQKSYFNYDEMVNFKKDFEKLKFNNIDFVIFPPILYLTLFKDSKYKVGTQNFYSYAKGSFTGEINLESLKNIGIKYTLINHFERRKIIGENYSIQKERLFKSLNSKCNTILCLGEPVKTSRPWSYIKKEITYMLRSIESDNIKYLSIAYEPNWAVGSGDVQNNSKIEKIVLKIKKFVKNKYDFDIPVYYGGSITSDNVSDIINITDGIVLGKASTSIDNIREILGKIK